MHNRCAYVSQMWPRCDPDVSQVCKLNQIVDVSACGRNSCHDVMSPLTFHRLIGRRTARDFDVRVIFTGYTDRYSHAQPPTS